MPVSIEVDDPVDPALGVAVGPEVRSEDTSSTRNSIAWLPVDWLKVAVTPVGLPVKFLPVHTSRRPAAPLITPT